jgi:stage V sporulation protein R
MHNIMADHAERIRFYQQKHGHAAVEKFLETCMSLDNLIDYLALPYDSRPLENPDEIDVKEDKKCGDCSGCDRSEKGRSELEDEDFKFRANQKYMDPFINPPEAIKKAKEREERRNKINKKKFPSIPQRDILRFVIKHGEGMEDWQRDILSIVREEAYYFAPQRRTKIMNEGWASYWHSHIMEDHGIAAREDLTVYAQTNAGVLAMPPGQINPYALGVLLYRDIEERWNQGRHGLLFETEKEVAKREAWDTGAMKGRKEMFQARATLDDVEFIRRYMSDDFIEDQLFYRFALDKRDDWYKIEDRDPEKIRRSIMDPLFNGGEPFIEIENGNFRNSRELLLRHTSYDGTVLDMEKMNDAMKALYEVWGRRVNLATVIDDKKVIVSYDGKFKMKKIKGSDDD